MQNAEQDQGIPPFIVIVKLHEGYVLNIQGYTIAVTNAADLGQRVAEVAAQSEVGFHEPQTDISDTVVQVQGPPVQTPPPMDVQETAHALQPVSDGVVPTTALETEWRNVRQMIAFMAAGFDSKGRAFLRKDWDNALPIFAPHVDPKEAEFELSEFLSELHDDE